MYAWALDAALLLINMSVKQTKSIQGAHFFGQTMAGFTAPGGAAGQHDRQSGPLLPRYLAQKAL